jgi:hypothetical protein
VVACGAQGGFELFLYGCEGVHHERGAAAREEVRAQKVVGAGAALDVRELDYDAIGQQVGFDK